MLDWFKIHKLPEPDGEIVETTDENIEVDSPREKVEIEEETLKEDAKPEEEIVKDEKNDAKDEGHGEL